MGAQCQPNRAPSRLSDKDLSTLRTNLAGYKSKAEDYHSQIHQIQQQIRAVTVLPQDGESKAMRVLLQQELRNLREVLITLVPEMNIQELELAAQTLDELKSTSEALLQEQGTRTLKIAQRISDLQQTMKSAMGDLRRRGVEVSGVSVLDDVLALYDRLVHTTKQPHAELAERVRQEELTTQLLSQQSSELDGSVEHVKSEVANKELQVNLTRHQYAEAQEKAQEMEIDLRSVKGDLLQCKEKIKELTGINEKLEGEIKDCMLDLTEEELQIRIRILNESIFQLESEITSLKHELSLVKETESGQETHIKELEQQMAAKESYEDVSDKMTSVQERLRDIMLSLESEGDGN